MRLHCPSRTARGTKDVETGIHFFGCTQIFTKDQSVFWTPMSFSMLQNSSQSLSDSKEDANVFGCHARRASNCAALPHLNIPQQQNLTQIEKNGGLRTDGRRGSQTVGTAALDGMLIASPTTRRICSLPGANLTFQSCLVPCGVDFCFS